MPPPTLSFSRLARVAPFVALVSLLAMEPARADEAAPDKAIPAKAGAPLLGEGAERKWTGFGAKAWPEGWTLADGVLHCAGGGGDLRTVEQYGDFDFRFEWKASPGANSGVIYLATDETKPSYHTGPEYQIFDQTKPGNSQSSLNSTASLYGLYAASKSTAKPPGQWNRGRIVVEGDRVRHYLNGEQVVDAHIGSDDWNRRVAASKFAAWKGYAKSPRGYIVLQDHGDEIWYRGMSILELNAAQGDD